MSAFEEIPQHIKDVVMTEIAEQLLDDWINNLLDEGQYFTDRNIAIMSGDSIFIEAFNSHYKLAPTDEGYIEC
jgi:hypothetical protein